MNSLLNLTPQQLRQAADLQERIASLQSQLARLLGGSLGAAPTGAPEKRRISAAGLARIRAAQKARWARVKAAAPSPTPAAQSGKKGKKMSAAAKAKIGARMRAVWAARKAAK